MNDCKRRRARLRLLVFAVLALSVSGCIGMAANLVNMVQGNTVPAKFDGLKAKRVAVVCVSDSSGFGPSSASDMLARRVSEMLQRKVEEIDVVGQNEVADWLDNNEWDYLAPNWREIGQAVEADMVVAITLKSFSLYEGQTLYKGRAGVVTKVFDLTQDGQEVFTETMPEFAFPAHGGHHATDVSEPVFRQVFVTVLAQKIARNFYPYDLKEEFASDAMSIGG